MDKELENFLDGLKESVQKYLYQYTKDRDHKTKIAAGQEFIALFRAKIVRPYESAIASVEGLSEEIEKFQQSIAKLSMGLPESSEEDQEKILQENNA